MLRISLTSLLVVSLYAVNTTPAEAQSLPDTTACFLSNVDSTTIANLNASPPSVQGGNPGAVLRFPNRGRVNALHIFVQFAADSVESNPVQDFQTEWPASLSLGPGNPLPTWADDMLADPGTDPSNYAEGSLSEYYHLMSGGRFKLEGYVYPQVYIPDHDPDWYTDTTSTGEFANIGDFANPSIFLSHEILSHVAANPQGIPFDELDRWQNGTADATGNFPDGVIDMVIISRRSTLGNGEYFRQITSFGSCHPDPAPSPWPPPGGDAFASDPIFFGTKQVIDNCYDGSGVIAGSQSVAGMANIVGHEIGHRQFGLYHVDYRQPNHDIFSTMMGWPAGRLSPMSLGDRVKLDWVTLDTLDVSSLSRQAISLDDTFEGGRALYVKNGSPNGGDVYVEARTQSNFWDRPPDGQNYDFDDIAIYLEEPGLMVYKRNSSGSRFSSMERTRLPERYSYWELTQCCFPTEGTPTFFTPGSMLSPFSVYRFPFSPSSDVDDVFALTDIAPTTNGYSFDVWGQYPTIETEGEKVVTEVSSFSDAMGIRSLARERLWTLGGNFVFTDSLYAGPTISTNSYPNIISFEENARLEVHNSTVEGTATYPVIFKPVMSGTKWDRILLKGKADFAHTFDHVRVEGAAVGLDVRTTSTSSLTYGAAVSNAVFVDNGVGISTDYFECAVGTCLPARSRVDLDRVLVEGSGTYGLYLRNTDFALSNSTVRDNNGHGIYVKNATSEVFSWNVIKNNGTSGSGYDGLRVEANGSVDFSDGFFWEMGRTRLESNADKEIVYLKGGYLFLGLGFAGGNNAVIDQSAGCRVYNASGSTLEAENTFWGTTSSPPSSYFCGGSPVDHTPFLTSDPTGNSGGGYRTTPGGNRSIEALLALEIEPAKIAGSIVSRGGDNDPSDDPVAWLRDRIRAVRAEVAGNPASESGPALVRRLAGLHRLDVRGETAEWPATENALRGLRNRLATGNPSTLPPGLRRTLESALVVALESALAADDYEGADALLSTFEPLVGSDEQALALGLNAVAVDEGLGRYDAALARLDELVAAVGDGHDGLGADLAFMAEVIAAKAEGAERGTGPATATRTGEAESAAGTTLPAEYALLAAYPNPTATQATVPFELPTAADVRIEVHDILGRRVDVLADGRYEAGRHRVVLDASGLGSGTYVVRAQLVPESGGVQVFTQKLTLVR